MRRAIFALGVVVALLLATGVALLRFVEGPPEHRAAGLVTEEVEWYLSVYLSPSTAQKRAIGSISGAVEDPGKAARSLAAGVTGRFGVAFDEVEPHLGREMAAFKLPYGGRALLLEMADGSEDTALWFEEKLIGDVIFRDGFVITGDEDALGTIGQDTSLADSHAWNLTPGIEDRVLAGFSTDDESFYELLEESGYVTAARLMQGLSHWWLSVDDGRIVIDGFSGSDGAFLFPDRDPPDMEGLPADSWLASEIPNLDHTLEALVEMLEAGWGRAGAVTELTSPLLAALDGARLGLGGSNILSSWVQLDAVVEDESSARRRAETTIAKAPRWGLDATGGEGTWTVDAGPPLGSVTVSMDDALRVRRGTPGPGPLTASERYVEARGWLGGMEPRLYVDLPRMSAAAGLVADTFLPAPGLTGLARRVDRVVVGVEGHAPGIASRIVIKLIPTEESSD